MEFGIILGDTPTTVSAAEHFDAVLRQVEAAQRGGMTYILIGQHFIYPGTRWFQPVPLLARLASEVDTDVKLVTQILIAPLYHPVMLAEELATLDVVTEGRLIVGLGLGYLPQEYDVFNVPLQERVARLEEIVEILKAMWTSDRVTYAGRFWQLDDAHIHIRPVQDPHPKIWIGARSTAGVRRAARIGDAWPITPQEPPEKFREQLKVFIDERERLGLPVQKQPLRREMFVGTDRADATAKAIEAAQPWYLHGARAGNPQMKEEEVLANMQGVVERSFVIGTPGECAAQLRAIGDVMPIDPVVTRSTWPGMTTEDSVAYLDSLGKELIPSMREYQSSTTLRL